MSFSRNDPYAAVLADLERKRAEIDKLIESLRVFRGIEPAVEKQPSLPHAVHPEKGEFTGKSMAEAAKIILERAGQPLSNMELFDALAEGGLRSTSENPLNIIGSTMNRRASEVGDVERVGRGLWAVRTVPSPPPPPSLPGLPGAPGFLAESDKSKTGWDD